MKATCPREQEEAVTVEEQAASREGIGRGHHYRAPAVFQVSVAFLTCFVLAGLHRTCVNICE
jgi:hypothetical protein